jgi:hypothetical protein
MYYIHMVTGYQNQNQNQLFSSGKNSEVRSIGENLLFVHSISSRSGSTNDWLPTAERKKVHSFSSAEAWTAERGCQIVLGATYQNGPILFSLILNAKRGRNTRKLLLAA